MSGRSAGEGAIGPYSGGHPRRESLSCAADRIGVSRGTSSKDGVSVTQAAVPILQIMPVPASRDGQDVQDRREGSTGELVADYAFVQVDTVFVAFRSARRRASRAVGNRFHNDRPNARPPS